jgi:hypothetical protein
VRMTLRARSPAAWAALSQGTVSHVGVL